MKYKLFCFDLDGVLLDARDYHYLALNKALHDFDYNEISYQDHLEKYDGLTTKTKLLKLDIPKHLHDLINDRKQEYTYQYIKDTKQEERFVEIFKYLKQYGKIVICSNSIRDTTKLIYNLYGDYIDNYYCNNDVINPKPHPEIYWKAMIDNKVYPDETLIFEDSEVGLKSAKSSNANYLKTEYKTLNINFIYENFNTYGG